VTAIPILLCSKGFSQGKGSFTKTFFTNESLVEIGLYADFAELRKNRALDTFRRASLNLAADTFRMNEVAVELKPRGAFRKEFCVPPPLMVNFKTNKTSPLYKLGKLKMVHACSVGDFNDQLIVKEYLVYKLYQVMTPLSFRVRLVKLNLYNQVGLAFSAPRLGFFIEDVDEMANRNDCNELPETQRNTESMNREANTLLALFQFMVGNTDWSVPLNRNVKIVQAEGQPFSAPFAVPYDFDYSGLVNAPYAIPYDELPIQLVTERFYRGYGRSMEELEKVLEIFRQRKAELYGVIQECTLLTKGNMREMISYLDGFFEIIDNSVKVKDLFIQNARKQ
jgi:hypothetical protein